MHAYPSSMADFIHDRWIHPADTPAKPNSIGFLPSTEILRELLSTCYQVSMMREETRGLTIRLILIGPDAFPVGEGPPDSFHRVLFDQPRPLNEYELRRLAPAVDYERSLIGIELTEQHGYQIWGVINSGMRWLQAERGGSKQCNLLPSALILHVNGPGMLTMCRGISILGILQNGRITEPASNVFQSIWINRLFLRHRQELIRNHEEFRAGAPVAIARIAHDFIEELQFQVIKRMISVTRRLSHGGSFAIFPERIESAIDGKNPLILLKYRFHDAGVIRRQQALFQEIIQTATTALGDSQRPNRMISWKDYVAYQHELLYDQEEALYELAHFHASLAAVDGAVVATPAGPVGFGGMIVGSLDRLSEVARAHDPEGKMVTLEKIEGVGSRHRSIYHLCRAHRKVMALIISQDGSVQLAKWRNGRVTYWDLTTTAFTGDQ